MIRLRKANERGRADYGWLVAQHSFSFANYYDPDHMGFRGLRVLNEDRIAPGTGFPKHSHRDMEILTYVISGRLEHKDSMGNGAVIEAGEFQMMSAGKGVSHSEANPSSNEETHLLQIWLQANELGLVPGYVQKRFDDSQNQLRQVASPTGQAGAMKIHQDVEIYSAVLDAGRAVEHSLEKGRHAWIQVISGELTVNGESLLAGDSAAASEVSTLQLNASDGAEFLLFDLA
ncbi:MAG: redox-sensitive bicupin YhaK (pirin superfamily) [Planctomycetota bacterium]|jgi:redox-sensitive bicupin YhaK (pirin superfamily)